MKSIWNKVNMKHAKIYDDINADEWDLTDEILSEGAVAEIPSRIDNIYENMEVHHLVRKNKSMINCSSFVHDKSDNNLLQKQTTFGNNDSNKMNRNQKQSKKKTLKEDISDLLKLLVNEKKNKKWTLEGISSVSSLAALNRTSDHLINSSTPIDEAVYVTMKDILFVEGSKEMF